MSAAADDPTANFQRTKIVGALIRSARKALGLKQEQLTALTGLGMTAIYHIESGERRNPEGEMGPYTTSAATLVKLARALNLTAAQLESVGRSDAAVMLLTEHLQPPGLDEAERLQLITLLRKLSTKLPFAQTIEFVGMATGQLNPPERRADDA